MRLDGQDSDPEYMPHGKNEKTTWKNFILKSPPPEEKRISSDILRSMKRRALP
jgi:hypothetical protein